MSETSSRILLVYHFFPKYRDAFLRSAQASGWALAADTITNDASMEPASPDAVTGLHRLRNIWSGPLLWQRGLARLVAGPRWRAVILLGSPYYISNYVAWLICAVRGIPVVYWTHGVRPRSTKLKRLITGLALAPAKAILVYGVSAKKQLVAPWMPARKIHVVYNSLNSLDGRSPSVEPKAKPTDPFTGIFVGRLVPRKRLDLLLQAVSLLQHRGISISLMIVGDGPEKANLETLASDLGIADQVRFHPGVYDEGRLEDLFAQCDFSAVPHAAGLSVVHALSYGLPVVTDDDLSAHGPEFDVLKDGENCLIYSAGDVNSLCDAIARLHDDYPGIVNVASMAKTVALFNPADQVEQMNQIIAGIIDRK